MASFKTVVQATSKTTAVENNRPNGRITTVALSDAAAGSFSFDLTCNKLREGAQIFLTPVYGGAGDPRVLVTAIADGSCTIKVKNTHASAALDAALSIDYFIFQN